MATKMVYNAEFPEGKSIPLTAEDIATQEASHISDNEVRAAHEAKVTAKIEADEQTATDKASARVKLKAEEYTPLTEAEADAITI